MAREVRAEQTAGAGQGGGQTPSDDYGARLYKLIPGEITAAYAAIAAIVGSNVARDPYLLGAAGILLVALPFYLWVVQGVRKPFQIAATTLSFPIWVACVSTDQVTTALHALTNVSVPSFAFGILLILWTALLPLFVR